MTLFLDFILINMHTTHAPYDYILRDLTKEIEATADFSRIATIRIFQSFRVEKMRILSIAGPSPQRTAVSEPLKSAICRGRCE
jgi:hypothetical protein